MVHLPDAQTAQTAQTAQSVSLYFFNTSGQNLDVAYRRVEVQPLADRAATILAKLDFANQRHDLAPIDHVGRSG